MRRIAAAFLLFLFAVTSAFSFEAAYFPVSSDAWKLTDDICRIAGVSGPSSYGPVTGHQLLIALDRAEDNGAPSALLEKAREMITSFYPFYSDDLGSISLRGTINLEAYLQSAGDKMPTPSFGYDDRWFIRGYRERLPLLSLELENTIGDFLYSRVDLSLRDKQYRDDYYWNDRFFVNGSTLDPDPNFPHDAGVSLALRNFSLITGRGKVSQGEGFTGNTAIGDNYDYQEFLKVGANTRNTGVFLTLTTFDSSRESIPDSTNHVSEPWKTHTEKFSGYKELRHSAGYEMTLFNRAKISLSMVTLLDTDNTFDFRYFNPFLVMHNLFNFHEYEVLEANNMISLDCSLALSKGWRVYLQVTMDQLQVGNETDGYESNFGYSDPNAFAGLMNISWSRKAGDEGILTLYGEGVFTMPGMYLNQKYFDANGNVTQHITDRHCWSQDFLLGYNRSESHPNDSNDADMAFSGYIYGPDAIVFSLGGKYYEPEKFEVKGSVFFMAHGEKGRGEDHNNYIFTGINSSETINTMAPTGVVEKTFVLKGECSRAVMDGIYIYGGAAFITYRNYMNEEGNNFSHLQTAFGIKLTDIFWN